MKITPLLITVAALAAPLSAQSRGGDTMVDSGATVAWGTVVGLCGQPASDFGPLLIRSA